jgi:hypothetical protein
VSELEQHGAYRPHASDAIRAQQQGEPEAIFTWVRLPQGGIRLYASRQLPDVAWGQREHREKGVMWHLDANLDGLLIVDRLTAAEAFAWVLERWNREDAEKAAEAQAELERKARWQQHELAGQAAIEGGPGPLTRGLPGL